MTPSEYLLYLANMQKIITQYEDDPHSRALKKIIDQAAADQKSPELLRTEIMAELNSKVRRGSRLSRLSAWLKKSHPVEGDGLKSELIALMDKNDEIVLITNPMTKPNHELTHSQELEPGNPYSPSQFIEEIFHAHIRYSNEEITLINNAILELIRSYEKHYEKYDKTTSPIEKKFHAIKLSILKQWTSKDGYEALIHAIESSRTQIETGGFKLSIDESMFGGATDKERESNQALVKKSQILLDWLVVVYEQFLAEESPDAMARSLTIIALFKNISKMDKIQANSQLIDQYKNFYLDSDAVARINIDSKDRTSPLLSIKEFNQALGKNDEIASLASIQEIRKNLFNIYGSLAQFSINLTPILKEFEKLLCETSPEQTKIFQEYFEKALVFMTQVVKALSKKTTNQSYEPLDVWSTKGLYFTPLSWAGLEGDPESQSKKLSNRSSERENSMSRSPSENELSKRTLDSHSSKSGGSGSMLSKIHRSRSEFSLSESFSQDNLTNSTWSLDQAGSTLAESSGSSKSKSRLSQLIDKPRLPTQ